VAACGSPGEFDGLGVSCAMLAVGRRRPSPAQTEQAASKLRLGSLYVTIAAILLARRRANLYLKEAAALSSAVRIQSA
jgi:hypothetical protein